MTSRPATAGPWIPDEPGLAALAAQVGAHPGARLVVTVHTDARGADTYNLEISQRRADAVIEWLHAHEVDTSRLTALGCGEAWPAGPTATSRIELRAIE